MDSEYAKEMAEYSKKLPCGTCDRVARYSCATMFFPHSTSCQRYEPTSIPPTCPECGYYMDFILSEGDVCDQWRCNRIEEHAEGESYVLQQDTCTRKPIALNGGAK